ncbi:MAG TPA: cyanophycinase, partial [Pyrinomonadaceae bacterium]
MFNKDGKGILIAVGGGESGEITKDSIKIFERFLEYAGGLENAKILIMTVATNNPEDAGKRYQELFDHLKFKNFEIVNIADRVESFDKKILKKVEAATGLYFTGGNQLHITALMGGTPLHQLILDKFGKGLVIGGTSAGAMMMSSSTLVSGEADTAPRLGAIEVAPGMELLDNSIIDTHFSQRGRHGRLLSAVVHNPQALGFGIDERTAMI